MDSQTPDLDALRRRLTSQAFLFDDPSAYTAGVEHAIAAVQQALWPVRLQAPSRDERGAS